MDKPSIPEVVDLFQTYYSCQPSWGSLHIVLADGNVQDADVMFCLQYARGIQDIEGEELAGILLRMSKTQRLKLPEAVCGSPA